MNEGYRTESDSMGQMRVPASAYYGAHTQRALENFPISGRTLPREFIWAMGLIKEAASQANAKLGRLDRRLGRAISRAAEEVMEGKWDGQFLVDVYESGSGTSINMNANEVIANRANQLLGADLGSYSPVHPNDHVNMGQSSNDVVPTAIHVAAAKAMKDTLIPALEGLRGGLEDKAKEFHDLVKVGRTHLQDALPITLGQEFGGYATQVGRSMDRVSRGLECLLELPLGGTAVGTGLHAPRRFVHHTLERMGQLASMGFVPARNPVESVAAREAVVETMGHLKALAISLLKISNDLRWMSSGPRCGLGEISLPAVQPGSSMMPGKVNPVIVESLMMACATVIGHDHAIGLAATMGNFELTAMMPMMADHLLDSIKLLANGCRNLADRCITKIRPNAPKMMRYAQESPALATALVPKVGYEKAARIAKEAWESGRPIKDVALELTQLHESELDRLLDPLNMAIRPQETPDPMGGQALQ